MHMKMLQSSSVYQHLGSSLQEQHLWPSGGMLALCAVDLGLIPDQNMGVQHTVLLGGQPPTVAFTVLVQLCGPKANKTEISAALFVKFGDGRGFDLSLTTF